MLRGRGFSPGPMLELARKQLAEPIKGEGFPAWNIGFLHMVPQGSCQMGRVVGTPSPSPAPSPLPSVGFTGGLSPPGSPPCLSRKVAGHQNVRSHTRMLGP